MAEWASVRSFNASQLSKAAEINTLQQGFGLTGFSGSTHVIAFITGRSGQTG
jgi:hypothetical protein